MWDGHRRLSGATVHLEPRVPAWRQFCFSLFAQVIQVPQGKYKVLPTERTKVSSYPVALIPGQFQEYYKRYGFLVLLLVGRGFRALCRPPRL